MTSGDQSEWKIYQVTIELRLDTFQDMEQSRVFSDPSKKKKLLSFSKDKMKEFSVNEEILAKKHSSDSRRDNRETARVF